MPSIPRHVCREERRPGGRSGEHRESRRGRLHQCRGAVPGCRPAASAALQRADTVVIMVGANDFLQPLVDDLDGRCSRADCYTLTEQSVAANVVETVQQIREIHPTPVSVIVVGYWNVAEDGSVGRAAYGVDGMARADRATAYANTALQQAAADTGAHYVATFEAFRGPDGGLDPTPLLAADGDHPNAAGHDRIAQALFDTVPDG